MYSRGIFPSLNRTIYLFRAISSHHQQLFPIIFFFFWNTVLQLILFVLYSFCIAFLIWRCLRFVHNMLLNLAGLILFSVPDISFIITTEPVPPVGKTNFFGRISGSQHILETQWQQMRLFPKSCASYHSDNDFSTEVNFYYEDQSIRAVKTLPLPCLVTFIKICAILLLFSMTDIPQSH